MYFWRPLLVVIWFHIYVCYAVPISSTSSAAIATATPLVIPPSQLWDGNDGPWSSFYLRVGSQPQTVRVLISTSSNQPLVVQPGGCSSGDSTCANNRGGVFQSNTSTTWSTRNSSTGGMYAIALDSKVGLVPGVQYGSDTLALGYLGSGAPALTSQLVGGITTTDLFTGIFGLNPSATNFSNDSLEVASYMSNLKAQNQIPSLSYGYNAGNGYRFNTVFASLTLGGYDNSLFNPNNLTFAFSNENNSDLTVNINSITTENSALSLSSFSAFIDTTTPYLWLPVDVCEKFEAAFGITYDNSSGLYLVNDTLHDALLSQNANITFLVGNATSSEVVDIVLPYAAFDLIASFPLVETPTRYFPLKRALSTSQVTLGRTFFQEAYLIADYERSTFSVHQMSWNPDAKADITSILPISISPSSSSTTTPPASSKKSTVPASTIVAATICGAAFLIILAASIIIIRQRKKKLDVLTKTPPTPAAPFTFAHNITPIDCAHCRTHTPSPEPVEAGSGSLTQSTMSSIQSSLMENYNGRDSTTIPSGLALGPVSPVSPVQARKDLQNTFSSSQNHQIPPSSRGPVIPPSYSSLDQVVSPTDYSAYEVPRVQSGIYELPAREEVATEISGTSVESILQAALDQVIINHNRETQPQQYLPYQPPTSPPRVSQRTIYQAYAERRLTLHSPVYGEPSSSSQPQPQPRPHPQIRIQTQKQTQNSSSRTSTWVHSPIYGTPRDGENWGTLNRGQQFTFDLHPQLRTARPQTIVQLGRGRDLIREHEERMREWEALRGSRPSSPPRRPLPNLPDGSRGVASPVSPGTLDPREYSWLRLH